MTKKINTTKKVALSILTVTLIAICFAVIGGNLRTEAACYHSPATRTTGATCTASGKRQTYCRICGKVLSTSYTSALGHNYQTTRNATCGASGLKKCTRCSATQSIAALGHNYQTTKAATCGAAGTKTCTRCSSTQTIAATGNHSPATRVSKAATCGATGTKQTYCTKCSNVLSTSTIAALGHNYQTTKAATCGATGTKKCSRCTSTQTIPATGQHVPNTENPKVTQPTCTSDGKKETFCKNCSTLMGTVTIKATGHNYARKYCTEDMKCSKCGAVATGSKEFCHALVVEKKATCTADGLKKCVNPNCPYTEVIKGGHTIVEATCSAPKRCTTCNATWGNGLGHAMTGGSCTEAAHCTRAGCTYKAPVEGHNYTRKYCTEDMKCSKCGKVATGSKEFCHALVVEKKATCTADGLKKCVNPNCPYTEVIKGGHTIVEATCSAPKRCTTCNATWGNGLGHVMTKGSCTEVAHCTREGCDYEDPTTGHHLLQDATCEKNATCKRCGFEVKGSAMGHLTSNSSCTEAAHCAREGCDYEKPATGHRVPDFDECDSDTWPNRPLMDEYVTHHQVKCADCGEWFKTEHKFEYLNNCDNTHSYQCRCGEIEKIEDCTLVEKVEESDNGCTRTIKTTYGCELCGSSSEKFTYEHYRHNANISTDNIKCDIGLPGGRAMHCISCDDEHCEYTVAHHVFSEINPSGEYPYIGCIICGMSYMQSTYDYYNNVPYSAGGTMIDKVDPIKGANVTCSMDDVLNEVVAAAQVDEFANVEVPYCSYVTDGEKFFLITNFPSSVPINDSKLIKSLEEQHEQITKDNDVDSYTATMPVSCTDGPLAYIVYTYEEGKGYSVSALVTETETDSVEKLKSEILEGYTKPAVGTVEERVTLKYFTRDVSLEEMLEDIQ